MTQPEQIVKDCETSLAGVVAKLKQEFGQIRGNRPSPEMLQDIKVNLYEQWLTVRELGSLSVMPPRTITITVWDKDAIGPLMNAIEAAHLGLSVANDGTTIRATLSSLGNERREELMKLVKKTTENGRIEIRARREDAIKRLKDAESRKEATQDDVFKTKEKIQKAVDKANKDAEAMMEAKLAELGE
jgi:ribosome recycling factor